MTTLDLYDTTLRLFAGTPTPVAVRKCRYCGCTESPDVAPDPYTTDGTVEVCPQCNEGESYVAVDPIRQLGEDAE
jgi:hypothetical protein